MHVEGLNPTDVMAIQLVDCARRFLSLDVAAIAHAAQGKIDSTWIRRILALSSVHADSPKETELRLLLSSVAQLYGVRFQEQVPFSLGGRRITTFDLAVPELKIGVMYDGGHHWEYSQRQKDAKINLEATRAGWTVTRCSSTTMREMVGLISDIVRSKSGRD